ncbi:Methionine gamma-lyase [compost metagenome]
MLSRAEAELAPAFRRAEKISRRLTARVLDAYAAEGLVRGDLIEAAGYGHDDPGRDKLDRVFARLFGAEAAMVRLQFVAGTHALVTALSAIVQPGDEILSLSGPPFPTLEPFFGLRGEQPGSLPERGVSFRQVPLTSEGTVDLAAFQKALTPQTKVITFQRAKGFEWRPSLSIRQLRDAIREVRRLAPGRLIFVDNCYGEFTDLAEPTAVGADLVAGSLIKNPGGGLVPSGGYVAGRRDLVERAAIQLTAPGIGRRGGATFHATRLMAQGLFEAPHKVSQALKIRMLFAQVFRELGYPVMAGMPANDTNLAIRLGSREELAAFTDRFNRACPINAGTGPEPEECPGYDLPLICSEGSFVEGATSELSCDAIWRDPATVYVNGGLSYEHGRIVLERLLAAHPWA